MHKKKQLLEQRAALVEKRGALLKQAETAEDPIELLNQVDGIDAELKPIDEKLAAIEKLEQRTRDNAEREAGQRGGGTNLNAHDRREDGTFTSLGEQMQAVIRAAQSPHAIDPRLRKVELAASGSNESVPSEGGFLVQQDFANELLRDTYAMSEIAPLVRKIPISRNANGVNINGLDETSRADGSRFGGIQAYWTDEAAEKTASKPKFRRIELRLKKLTGLHYMTDELMEDAPALESFSRQAFPEEFAFKVDDAVLNGNGADRPLGILQSQALVTVPKEAGQAPDTFTFENAVKMYSRLPARARRNARWFINQDVETQLFTMAHVIGTGGVPVYLPPGGASVSPYATLLGRPVVVIEQASTLGDVGDVILADMSQYILADKGGIQSAVSIHVRFIYDETVIRFVYRVDGQPTRRSAMTPYKGTQTLSPYVTLAARA